MPFAEDGILESSEHYYLKPSAFALSHLYYAQSLGRFDVDRRYSVSRFNYDSILLICVTSGCICCGLGDVISEAHTGDVLLINCHDMHHYRATTDSSFWFVHFGGGESRQMADMICERTGPCLHPDRDLTALIAALVPGADGPGEADISRSIYTLMMELLAASGATGPVTTDRPDFTGITLYIQQHLAQPLNVQELARRYGYSDAGFTRLFRKCAGLSPYQFITRCRIDRSKHLLSNTRLQVQQIAERSGFLSAANFCAVFRRYTGMTPGEYRQQPL